METSPFSPRWASPLTRLKDRVAFFLAGSSQTTETSPFSPRWASPLTRPRFLLYDDGRSNLFSYLAVRALLLSCGGIHSEVDIAILLSGGGILGEVDHRRRPSLFPQRG